MPRCTFCIYFYQLREVEIKRLRVELQVSNLQQTLSSLAPPQPLSAGPVVDSAVEESLRRYESRLKLFTSQLNTPTSRLTMPRTVSDLTNNTFDFMPNESFVRAVHGLPETPGKPQYFVFPFCYFGPVCRRRLYRVQNITIIR